MKHLFLYIILLIPLLVSGQYDTTNIIFNPVEDRFDMISRLYPGHDTVINIGTNNTIDHDTLNGVVGHSNTVAVGNGLSIGYYNTLNHVGHQFGAYLESDTGETVTIGRGFSKLQPLKNSKWGTVGLGYFSTKPILYVQSGLESGESWTEDIGGVSIGGPDLDTLTALQITAHKDDGTSYLIKGKSSSGTEVFSVNDQGDMTISGAATIDSIVCSTVPTVHTAAGDTSNYDTPDKVGDLFIDTSTGDSYMSTGTTRGDWVKLNFIFPFILAVRRKWLFSLLLFPVLALGQEQGKITPNPFTGEIEFTSNYYYMVDTLINFGRDNVFVPGKLNGILGHNNYAEAANGIILGNYNESGCGNVFLLGNHIRCAAYEHFVIGTGGFKDGGVLSNHFAGSIGIGSRSLLPYLHIHSGYVNQDPWVGNIGGVCIGFATPDSLSRFEIYGKTRLFDGGNYTYLLKGNNSSGSSQVTIESSGETTLSGTLVADDISSDSTPNVYHSAGDTTLFPTPWAVGDFYVNTADKQVYSAKGTNRGDWIMIGE